jgi:hypothetical protein
MTGARLIIRRIARLRAPEEDRVGTRLAEIHAPMLARGCRPHDPVGIYSRSATAFQ